MIPVKYYVSTTDGIAHGGCRRLTPYFKTLLEAENVYYQNVNSYRPLMLRTLTNNRIRKTIKTNK